MINNFIYKNYIFYIHKYINREPIHEVYYVTRPRPLSFHGLSIGNGDSSNRRSPLSITCLSIQSMPFQPPSLLQMWVRRNSSLPMHFKGSSTEVKVFPHSFCVSRPPTNRSRVDQHVHIGKRRHQLRDSNGVTNPTWTSWQYVMTPP